MKIKKKIPQYFVITPVAFGNLSSTCRDSQVLKKKFTCLIKKKFFVLVSCLSILWAAPSVAQIQVGFGVSPGLSRCATDQPQLHPVNVASLTFELFADYILHRQWVFTLQGSCPNYGFVYRNTVDPHNAAGDKFNNPEAEADVSFKRPLFYKTDFRLSLGAATALRASHAYIFFPVGRPDNLSVIRINNQYITSKAGIQAQVPGAYFYFGIDYHFGIRRELSVTKYLSSFNIPAEELDAHSRGSYFAINCNVIFRKEKGKYPPLKKSHHPPHRDFVM